MSGIYTKLGTGGKIWRVLGRTMSGMFGAEKTGFEMLQLGFDVCNPRAISSCG